MNFKKMQKDVHENSVKHGFWDGYVSPHDANCVSTPDGACVGHGCMHDLGLLHRAQGVLERRAGVQRVRRHSMERVLLHGGEENRLVPTKIALIHSEVSEALECYRNGEMVEHLEGGGTDEDGVVYPAVKPCGMPSELADIVIRVMDLSEALGIDLGAAIERKHAYNVTRPYKHGGKAV